MRLENKFDSCSWVSPERSALDIRSQIQICARTHIGRVRKSNEDRYLVKKIDGGSVLLAVADGMGGEVAGERAAEITMDKLAGIQPGTDGIEKQLAFLTQEADNAIQDEVNKKTFLEGMGTTVTGVLLRDGIAYWVHVGDSRLYVLCHQKLIRVTKDQNMVQFLLDEGEITEEEARTHHSRRFLDQCVGCGHCQPETGCFQTQSKDLIFLTTDGLHGKLTDEFITSILTLQTCARTKAESLVQAALNIDGRDNITIVIAEI